MLKDLFNKLFEKDPEKRIVMIDIMNDPWVTRDGSSEIELGLETLTSNDSAFMFGSVGKVEVDQIQRDINGDSDKVKKESDR